MSKNFTRYWGSHLKSLGHENVFAVEFEALRKRGWKCQLVMEREPDDPSWSSRLRSLGVNISCVPRPKSQFDLQNISKVRQLCKNTDCDVFHCDNMHTSPLIGAAMAGVPVRIWCKHSMNSDYEQGHNPGLRERISLSTRLSAILATKVIAVSRSVAQEMEGLSIGLGRTIVLNNPRPGFKTAETGRDTILRGLGIEQGAVIFVSVGRAEKVKGWDLLIEAFNSVATINPDFRLLLIGATGKGEGTEYWKKIEALAESSGASERIHFTGHVPDVRSFLVASDVFVLPSRSEGCCVALLEALGAGLPCISTKVGNADELIEDGISGLLVEREDIAGLSEAMTKLVIDSSLRAEMAARAVLPTNIPDSVQHAELKADIYEELLAGKSSTFSISH